MAQHYFQQLVQDFSRLPEVEAILLSGSRTANAADEHSDYDLYVYVEREIPVTSRQAITEKSCSYMELNNQFWETEDDGVLSDDVPIDIIYRSIDWLDGELERVLLKHQAGTGYTTCFWSNLLNSEILYDHDGRAQQLREKYQITYPVELKRNIVRKNYPLLMQQMPAYYYQIKKAIQRDDLVSVNHRLAEFLASYFDILFAVNEYPHPGEKKLLDIAEQKCRKVPEHFRQNLTNLLGFVGTADERMLSAIEDTVRHLDALLQQEGLLAIVNPVPVFGSATDSLH
jgi:predicted nucleotidyltransferase